MSALVDAIGLALPGRLKETSLTLDAGVLACLVGPNGSGKTSLLHALAGIGAPAGRILIAGTDPVGLAPAQRQRLLAFLPASRDVAWPLPARDLVALGAPADEDRRRIPDLFGALDLFALADRRVDRLSTGERTRVLIARALVAQPRLLLLDEPVANLDPFWQLRLMDHLHSLARETGQALLIAVHDLELARSHADRLIVMDSGRIAADGDPRALLDGPVIREVFGIERIDGRWRPLGPTLLADPRSSP